MTTEKNTSDKNLNQMFSIDSTYYYYYVKCLNVNGVL